MKFAAETVQTTCDSPLGPMILAASDTGLAGAWFDGQRHQPNATQWPVADNHPLLRLARTQLSDYFASRRRSFDLPLDLRSGTEFQQDVWRALLKIPYGTTLSYGALSASLGKPGAVRAVAAAIGRNPLSIVVPCHRVLGASGALTGYAGGLDRKAALLKLEGRT